MPKFKENPSPLKYGKKSSTFKMKMGNSPLKWDPFGWKERRRRRWAKKDEEERRESEYQDSLVRG